MCESEKKFNITIKKTITKNTIYNMYKQIIIKQKIIIENTKKQKNI